MPAKETINFPAPRTAGAHGALSSVEIVPAIIANERVIDLKMSSGHSFRLTAKAAHLLSAALYGLSEDHEAEVPAVTNDLKPGDLVSVLHRRFDGTLHPHRGYYPDGTWRVSGTAKTPRGGYIYLIPSPRAAMSLISLDLVTFHSRPAQKKNPA